MKLRSFANQVSGTFSSQSVLQILSVLIIVAVGLSVFFPAYESVAGDAADDVADAAGAVSLIAGGVALGAAALATAPLVVTVAATVGACTGAYYLGYKFVGLFIDDSSS